MGITLRTLNYGNYGIFLIMGNAGFCPSTVPLNLGPGRFSSLQSQGLHLNMGKRVSLGDFGPGGPLHFLHAVDGQNPALPVIRNIP